MEKKDRVFVSKLEELFSGILQKQNVSIVKRISNLKCIHSISTFCINLSRDFSRGKSKVINAIVKLHTLEEASARPGNELVSLVQDDFCLGVLC